MKAQVLVAEPWSKAFTVRFTDDEGSVISEVPLEPGGRVPVPTGTHGFTLWWQEEPDPDRSGDWSSW